MSTWRWSSKRQFAALWSAEEFAQSVVAQIGWTHHVRLLDAFGTDRERYEWYAQRAIEGSWSARQLKAQIRLRRFVVIDLKVGEFEAEFAGKMGLYLAAVDEQLRHPDDAESIGLILCTSHNETVAKFALHRHGAPIAIADWQTDTNVDVTDEIPANLQEELSGMPQVRDQLTSRLTRAQGQLAVGSRNDSEGSGEPG